MQDSEGSWSWRPVFSSRPDGLPERLVRRLSAAGKQKDLGLRRIIPNTGSAPTLLLGTSISNRKSTTVAERDRPHSSIEFRDPFKPVNTAPSRTGTPFTIEESSHRSAPSTSDEGEPGGQVTIADPTDATGSTIPRSSSLDRGEGSAPSSPSNNHPKLEGTILNSPLTPGKRNALGQNTFRLSGTVPRGGFPMPETSAPRRRIISFPLSGEAKADMGCRRDTIKRPSTSDAVPLPSLQHSLGRQSDPNFSFHSCPRTKRHSIAASDPASTIIGSDDTRIFTSGEEDETDFFSDAAFDSIRTHLTTNSSCAPNESRIEAIFDRNFPMGLMGEEPPKLEDLISHGTFTPRASGGNPLFPDTELLQQPNENPTSKRDSLSSDWSDEDTRSLVAALPGEIRQQSLQESCQSALPESNRPEQRNGGAFPATGVLNTNDASNMQPGQDDWRSVNTLPKMNIFDWSEQRRNDSETAGSETRPRTVHGKHLNETRGSRAPGRKVQSTLHLRSQSVPTPREPGAVNESRQTSGKFGTWGLGTKGVSEDWDGDFDFDDGDEDATGGNMKTEENHCRQGMIVPQAIMERQDSLHGQFGLVQELTLLVEELKRLRQQAIVLDIVHGPSNELWKEAEGIINLATIDEESSHSPPRSPSSLAFSFDDSEEDSTHTNSPSKRGSGGSWQGSLLDRTGSNGQNSPHRRRRDSSPEAKFALDMACKSIPQNSASNDTNIVRGRKLPFNTQSLHDLVARSGVVTRALKDVIRSAEGVTTTPGEDSPRSDPPFSRIFDRPSHGHLASERPR